MSHIVVTCVTVKEALNILSGFLLGLEKLEGNFEQMLLCLVIFKRTVYYSLEENNFSVGKKNKILKYTEKVERNTGKVREFYQSGKVGTMIVPNREIFKC